MIYINNYMEKFKRKRIVLSQNKRKEMIDRYISGESAEQLARIYNINPTTVRINVRKSGMKVRTLSEAARQYTFNHNFFNTIDTEAKAYFLGLLLADGCVHKNDVIIGLQTRDRHILETFLEYINGNNQIKDSVVRGGFLSKQGSCVSTLAFYSTTKMVTDLKALGLRERKTYDIILPKLNINLERHFWRGVFDGDGTIVCNSSKRQIYTSICGHFNTITAFTNFLKRNNIQPNKIRPVYSIYNTCITTNKALKFLDLIYSDSDPKLCLKRKYEKYLEYLEYKKY